MDCRSAFEMLSAEIDGELSPGEARAVLDHVRTCGRCARARSVFVQTRQAFRSAAPERSRLVSRSLLVGLAAGLAVMAALATVGASALWNHSRNDRSGMGPTQASQSVQSAAPPVAETAGIGLAADCLRPGAVDCRIDVPCADLHCAPVAVTAAYVMPPDR